MIKDMAESMENLNNIACLVIDGYIDGLSTFNNMLHSALVEIHNFLF